MERPLAERQAAHSGDEIARRVALVEKMHRAGYHEVKGGWSR